MVAVNSCYLNLQPNYLFQDIAYKVRDLKNKNPNAKVISLGIGDVTKHIPLVAVEAMHKAADEMGDDASLRGYAPDYGYDFLRKAIAENDYRKLGIDIADDEIFVSDGAKCDVANLQEIFSLDAKVCIPDPVYPVYRDSNIMAGREITFVPCLEENAFMPSLPEDGQDLIYLCSPNNPTGTAMTKEELTKWVEYARKNKSIIIFDSAYKEYISDEKYPKSIYEIDGAKEVAIESRSFSKTAGFTGVRSGYLVVPKDLMGTNSDGGETSLHSLWSRRMSTKYNGNSYVVQRATEALFTPEGQKQCKDMIAYYMENARILRDGLEELGFKVFGGQNAPYIWFKVDGSSMDFFTKLLNEAYVVCTPGSGFGKCGEGYIRFTSFGDRENVKEALDRIKKVF